jgi:hypothetical protein
MNMITMTGADVQIKNLKQGDRFKLKYSNVTYLVARPEPEFERVIVFDESGKEREFFEGSPVRPIKSY